MADKGLKGAERRRAPRRPILDSFSLFVAVPKKGGAKLPVHDISELGMGFDLDLEGEGTDIPVKLGETFEVQFYLNQTLYLPLQVRVARIEEKNGIRRVGAEFPDQNTPYNRALNSFIEMIDSIGEVARLSANG